MGLSEKVLLPKACDGWKNAVKLAPRKPIAESLPIRIMVDFRGEKRLERPEVSCEEGGSGERVKHNSTVASAVIAFVEKVFRIHMEKAPSRPIWAGEGGGGRRGKKTWGVWV